MKASELNLEQRLKILAEYASHTPNFDPNGTTVRKIAEDDDAMNIALKYGEKGDYLTALNHAMLDVYWD